jgi:hypothetical protein
VRAACAFRAGPQARSLGLVAAAQDDAELLAAVAAGHVGQADRVGDQPAGVRQRDVATEVAEGVVDLLEVVDVDHQGGITLATGAVALSAAGADR